MSNAGAKAALDALTALLNSLAAPAIDRNPHRRTAHERGRCGHRHASGHASRLSNPAFGASTDANPGALATANAITDDSSADNTGTAGWFRAKNGSAPA
jgi:hypothetical protein